MSYIPYKSSSIAWNNIQGEVYGKTFYPLQEGQGSEIKIVSPAEGSIQRAKSELKRQLTDPDFHSLPSKKKKYSSSTSSSKSTKKKKKSSTTTSTKSKQKSKKKKKTVKKTKKSTKKSKPKTKKKG